MLYCIQEIVPEWEVRDREEGLVLALYEKIGIAADIRTNKLEPICTFQYSVIRPLTSTLCRKEKTMAFSYNTKLEIHDKAGGQCECTRQGCSHVARCAKVYQPTTNPLYKLMQYAEQYIFPGFEFHHISSQVAGGPDTAANGAFLCTFCHQQTNSYGANLTGSR